MVKIPYKFELNQEVWVTDGARCLKSIVIQITLDVDYDYSNEEIITRNLYHVLPESGKYKTLIKEEFEVFATLQELKDYIVTQRSIGVSPTPTPTITPTMTVTPPTLTPAPTPLMLNILDGFSSDILDSYGANLQRAYCQFIGEIIDSLDATVKDSYSDILESGGEDCSVITMAPNINDGINAIIQDASDTNMQGGELFPPYEYLNILDASGNPLQNASDTNLQSHGIIEPADELNINDSDDNPITNSNDVNLQTYIVETVNLLNAKGENVLLDSNNETIQHT